MSKNNDGGIWRREFLDQEWQFLAQRSLGRKVPDSTGPEPLDGYVEGFGHLTGTRVLPFDDSRHIDARFRVDKGNYLIDGWTSARAFTDNE